MAITNKNKEKDSNLEEIEKDSSIIDPITAQPIEKTPEPKLDDLLAKNPDELTASDMDFLDTNKDDLTDEQKIAVGLMDSENVEKTEEIEEIEKTPEPVEEPKTPIEDQIQVERNKVIASKVEEADKLPEPTEEELRIYVRQEGSDLDELTNFERSMAKRNLMAEKRLSLVTEGIKSQQKVDAWSNNIDSFIDSTDGKPEFVKLSGHETEFKKFAMQETHRGADIQSILLPAFLYNLPVNPPKRGSLFERGGGGERIEKKNNVVDADYAANLRVSDPREYARQLKAGKIKIEID